MISSLEFKSIMREIDFSFSIIGLSIKLLFSKIANTHLIWFKLFIFYKFKKIRINKVFVFFVNFGNILSIREHIYMFVKPFDNFFILFSKYNFPFSDKN